MGDLENLSKAIEAACKLTKPVVDTVCDFLKDLLGEPCKVVGAMLGDQIYAWQWRNRIRIAERAKEIMESRGIAKRIVPPGFLLSLLEPAGNVEEPSLQALWSELLASGVAKEEDRHPLFIETLRRLSSADADSFTRLMRGDIQIEELSSAVFARLLALNLIFVEIGHSGYDFGVGVTIPQENKTSEYARQFSKAVGILEGPREKRASA